MITPASPDEPRPRPNPAVRAEQEGEIVFWGKWQPESRLVARYASMI